MLTADMFIIEVFLAMSKCVVNDLNSQIQSTYCALGTIL